VEVELACVSLKIFIRDRLTKLPHSGFKFSQLEMSTSSYSYGYALYHSPFVTEIVLSLLIESFRFAPPNKEIYWQMTTIATPTVVGEGGKVQLPLLVSKV
jgi:hypothetical protein